MKKLNLLATGLISLCSVYFANAQQAKTDKGLPEIKELYKRIARTNQYASKIFNTNGTTYQVITFQEKEDKTLEIEVHKKGSLERKFSDKYLDGLVEFDPKPLLVEEKTQYLGKVKSYTFGPIIAPEKSEKYKKEYLAVVEMLNNIEKPLYHH